MEIYVGKNGQQLGPFSLEEVNRKLADGSFAATDLGWYEGAAGWAPLSGVPGVVIPPASAAPATPFPAPAPAPAPKPAITPAPAPAPAPAAAAPIRANVPIVQAPRSNTRTLSLVSWVLLGITAVISFIPFLGCGTWFLVWPVAIGALIMGIIVLTRGGTGQGISIIIASILIVPLCFLGSVVSVAVFGGTMERQQEKQILENLSTIDSAKTKWAAETKANPGATVTMAALSSQLGGKEVKSVVDETYDPMPVGKPPTATLPSTKTLGTFKGGDVLTAASLEKEIATNSIFNWNVRKTTALTNAATSPTPTVAPKASPSPSPSPSPAPSLSASPRPSVSPRSSSPPHSLISPRQSVEPEESPRTGPSPSAKFAPRVRPRQSPSPSEEDSSGLKQGRQHPRESPAETPEKKDDDDSDE